MNANNNEFISKALDALERLPNFRPASAEDADALRWIAREMAKELTELLKARVNGALYKTETALDRLTAPEPEPEPEPVKEYVAAVEPVKKNPAGGGWAPMDCRGRGLDPEPPEQRDKQGRRGALRRIGQGRDAENVQDQKGSIRIRRQNNERLRF